MSMRTFIKAGRTVFFLPILLSIFLTACGGGGNTGSSNTPASGGGTSTGGTVATGTYALSWDQVADPSVTGYKVYYANGPFVSGAQVRTIDIGTTSTYQVNASALGLPAGTTIYLAVAAVSNGTESPLSDPVSVVLQ